MTVDESYKEILKICLEACIDNVPMRRNVRKSIIPRDRKLMMRKRHKLTKRLENENPRNIQSIKNKIIKLENDIMLSHKIEKEQNEEKALSAIKTNPKYFYTYAKKYSTIKSKIGPLIINDEIISEPFEISEVLRKQYDSVFTKPSHDHKIHDPKTFFSTMNTTAPAIIEHIYFDHNDIIDAIKSISSNSAAGPDNFPAILLKTCANELSVPLCILWHLSIESGDIPPLLKEANIAPIYKGGSRGLPKNYRPVALTSHLIKIFEKIVVKRLTEFLEINNHMNENQHGFRSGRSCLSQLLAHYEKILNILESGKVADVVYLDFAKAFDKVDHGILMHKMKHYNVTGKVAIWIQNFLSERKQRVTVENHASKDSPVTSGVPQGTVLGPLLFLILISDIDKNIQQSSVSSFADDTRVLKDVSNINDCNDLKNDLQKIYNWASENNMCFNSCKFETMRYTTQTSTIELSSYAANDGTEIEKHSDLRDLGVTMSDDATFHNHINNIVRASKMKSGWILRTFSSRDKISMLTLWKQLVIPVLDYCSQLWSPWTRVEISKLEAVQRTFTSKITEVNHLNYWERLKLLKLYSLQRRRERYIIIYVWKMICGLVPNIGIVTKEHQRHGIQCNVRKISTRAPAKIQTICSASLKVRGCKLFNLLPKHIRNLKDITVENFKQKLDRFLNTIPDQPSLPGYFQRAENNSLLAQVALQLSDASRGNIKEGGAPAPPGSSGH